MPRPFTDITLNEGYTDLLTFDVSITEFEVERGATTFEAPDIQAPVSNSLLFQLKFNGTGNPIPIDYKAVFKLNPVSEISLEYTHYPNSEGYVQVETGILPITVLSATEAINLKVEGNVTQRRDESYLRLGAAGSFKYTLITDLVVDNGYLCVYDNISTYHRINPNIEVSAGTNELLFTNGGKVYKYNSGTHSWSLLGTLKFYQFPNPILLTSVTDGFYSNNSEAAGVPVEGTLGVTGGFTNFSLRLQNPDSFKVDLNLKIYKPESGTAIHEKNFAELEPGSLKINIVNDVPVQSAPADTSPQLSEIEAAGVANTTFSNTFKTFLTDKGLTRLKTIAQAGPIHYVDGFPGSLLTGSGTPVDEVKLLQSHVDLYSVNQNLPQNQHFIDSGYGSLYKISTTDRSTFINEVAGAEGINTMKAGQIHEVVHQTSRFISTIAAGTLNELKSDEGASKTVGNSSFGSKLGQAANSCNCSDCQSKISPFNYLMNLLDYSWQHITYNNAKSADLKAHCTLLETKFLQPIGKYKVTCDTLHDEYCRVRLVTEVLEAAIPSTNSVLDKDRSNFLWLVYTNVLSKLGTSVTELRDIVNLSPQAKLEASQKLADRLGIPLDDWFAPGNYTSNTLYTTTSAVTATFLQSLFGFRDTKLSPTIMVPPSWFERWQEKYLKDNWRTVDYPLTSYSRESVNISNPTLSTFKSNWKPIIDPDIIGWADFSLKTDPVASALYLHRKTETDNFLSLMLNPNWLKQTAADLTNRIVRVLDRNLLSHEFENDVIQIQQPAGTWTNFSVLNKTLNEIDTDIYLKKSTPAASQPAMLLPFNAWPSTIPLTHPKIRYNRVLDVIGLSPITLNTNFTITWPTDVISDLSSTPLYKLVSADGLTSYDTTSGLSFVSSTANSVTLQITNPPVGSIPVGFETGTLKFVYKTEVTIYSDALVDPEAYVPMLFKTTAGLTWTYNLMTPAAFAPSSKTYTVWAVSGWAAGTEYMELKKLYKAVLSGTATTAQLNIIKTDLRMSMEDFSRFLQILVSCEEYLKSIYSVKRPSSEELFEMASLVRKAAKPLFRDEWVREEILHTPTLGTPAKLMLKQRFFWKSLEEPPIGAWDPTLQTIPNLGAPILPHHTPILDPEILDKRDILDYSENTPYLLMLDDRKSYLAGKLNDLYNNTTWLSYGINIFTNILKWIATGSATSSYSLSPYSSLDDLFNKLSSSVTYDRLKAKQKVWDLFQLNEEDFNTIYTTKVNFESGDPVKAPTPAQIDKAYRLSVSAYKRKQLYNGPSIKWIVEEVSGGTFNAITIPAVRYHNVLKMRMAPGRSEAENRAEWQRTLIKWNRRPYVHPDYVPAENILKFTTTNWISTQWNTIKTALSTLQTTIKSDIKPTSGNTITNAFDKFRHHLNRAIARVDAATVLTGTAYIPYFLKVSEKEAAGEDIRPYLERLCITVTEYRFLYKIYKLLEPLYPSTSASPLLDSEVGDLADIFIHIGSHFDRYDQVWAEYQVVIDSEKSLLFNGTYFQNYKALPTNLQVSEIVAPNKWRSRPEYRMEWRDTLDTRIERTSGIKEKLKTLLEEVEEKTMPFMRDALIKRLTANCESHNDAAERLARKYFMETKDNCCMKHTRVSFAIETIQGFINALSSGIIDSSLKTSFKLAAQNFVLEWKWLGSYASWRSAMFVFLYPENLLHPALRKKQSPAFTKLLHKLATSNRFSPEDACHEAKEFHRYVQDICDLNIVCSTTAEANLYSETGATCCDSGITNRIVNYFFGQCPSTGRTYWTNRRSNLTDPDTFEFWEEIPEVPAYANVLGCSALGSIVSWWRPNDYALWLFYSYHEKGKLVMAALVRDLINPNSPWMPTEMPDLPKYIDSNGNETDVLPYRVIACQHSSSMDDPCFIFSFIHGWTKHHVPFIFERYVNKFDNIPYDKKVDFVRDEDPKNAIYFQLKPTNTNQTLKSVPWVTIIFDKYIRFSPIRYKTSYPTALHYTYPGSILGAYLAPADLNMPSAYYNNTMIVLFKDGAGKKVERIRHDYSPSTVSGFDITHPVPNRLAQIISLANQNQQWSFAAIDRIYPFYRGGDYHYENYFALEGMTPKTKLAAVLNNYHDPQGYGMLNIPFGLVPQKNPLGVLPEIISADCFSSSSYRKSEIENVMWPNFPAPLGSSPTTIDRTRVMKELMFETYFHVPLLLALDQQKRGQYPAALSWYRSLYDYTIDITGSRKLFKGLEWEANISTTFDPYTDWLKDPINPHHIATYRRHAFTKYTLMNLVQCLFAYGDREFTLDTIESLPRARRLYSIGLELLKVTELRLKYNDCVEASVDCIDTNTGFQTARTIPGTYNALQDKLGEITSQARVQAVITTIEGHFSGSTEANIMEKYALAFGAIEAELATQASQVPEDLDAVMEEAAVRSDETLQYILATSDMTAYNEYIISSFTSTAAGVSGVALEDALDTGVQSRFAWMTEPEDDNSGSYNFAFADGSGNQNFTDAHAYNPAAPTSKSYQSNFNYTNAAKTSATGGAGSGVILNTYIPFIDYKFCIPNNPIYKSLELKGNLELYKIFNCRNIAGMVRELNVYSAATDSVTGMPVIGASGNLILPGLNAFTPSQYRFKVLIERAKQICEQAKQLESMFLAAMEKEDHEIYSQLQGRQGIESATATVKLQDLRVTQAKSESSLASLQRDKVNVMINHYENLINEDLIGFEQDSLDALQRSIGWLENAMTAQIVAAALYAGQGILHAVAATMPAGAVFSAAGSVTSLASAVGSAASVSSTFAGAYSTQSSIDSIKSSVSMQLASFERRRQDWTFQRALADQDGKIANQQIKIAEDNIRIVGQEREIAQLNVEHAKDAYEFVKNKFTNAALYSWMGNVLESSYSLMLNISTAVAKTAESQLYFERQEQAGPFILSDYWETPGAGSTSNSGSVDRRGLTGSARLLVDIIKLEQHAMDTLKRKLQLTKVISLSNNFPTEFQRFRETGILNFELTNKMFDYDFPGHYLRLINSVKTTVVGLVPVYDSIKATLTAGSISYTVIGGTLFQKTPIRRLELDSVALTATVGASGVFEMQSSQNELLNPFEGIGIESRWEFKMPKFSNHMDYSNIADILLTVEYTALDSFDYRYQVLQELDNRITFNRGFSFRNDFPDQWYELAEPQESTPEFSVNFGFRRTQFPAGIDNIKLNGDIRIYLARTDGFTDEIENVEIRLASVPGVLNGSTTDNGFLNTTALMNTIGGNPIVNLKLIFANTLENRLLFSEGKIEDILVIIKCKGDLKPYPL